MSVYVRSENITIANGQTASSAFVIQDYTAGSFQVPAAISGANFTVHVSNDNVTFGALEDAAGAAVAVIPVSANEACPLPAGAFNFKFAKLVSAGAEGALRTIAVLLKAA
jgi:hypothetical protein